ncbi:hypothetical protein FLA_2934 [Filimonas lacunae]|nr:hypothetical protein FLA_2934 [Filimonas lacunae]
MAALLENGMAAKKVLVDPGLTVYQLPDGCTVELYCAGSCYPPYLFAHGDVVIGYRVHNLQQSMEELTASGGRMLGEVVDLSADNCYCFMEMNEGGVVGLYQLSAAVS